MPAVAKRGSGFYSFGGQAALAWRIAPDVEAAEAVVLIVLLHAVVLFFVFIFDLVFIEMLGRRFARAAVGRGSTRPLGSRATSSSPP